MRWSKLIHILLIVAHLLAAPTALLAEEAKRTVATHVRSLAGGWGIATPLMIAGVGIYQHLADKEDWDWSDLFNREVAGGLVGDFTTVAIFTAISSALPLSPLISSYFVTFGGFLGWEIGSGNVGNADWVSIFAQAGAATLIRFALESVMVSMGFSLGAIPLMALSIAGAMVTAWVLDSIRGEPEAEAQARGDPRDELDDVDWTQDGSPLSSGGSLWLRDPAPRSGGVDREGYQELVDDLETGDLPAIQKSYQRYQAPAR